MNLANHALQQVIHMLLSNPGCLYSKRLLSGCNCMNFSLLLPVAWLLCRDVAVIWHTAQQHAPALLYATKGAVNIALDLLILSQVWQAVDHQSNRVQYTRHL